MLRFLQRKSRHAAEALVGLGPHFAGKKFERNRRTRQIGRMSRPSLSRQHVQNCKVLPDRETLLMELPKDAIVAEIGVAFGDFSKAILSLSKPRRLHLIDLWQGPRYEAGLTRIEKTLANEIAGGKVVIDRGLSAQQLSQFTDHYFDWVYIDTDHSYPTTLEELRLCASKVKPGGYIAGHDFCTGNIVKPVVFGVVQACNQFCVEAGYEYAFLTIDTDGHFSFALKKSESPGG